MPPNVAPLPRGPVDGKSQAVIYPGVHVEKAKPGDHVEVAPVALRNGIAARQRPYRGIQVEAFAGLHSGRYRDCRMVGEVDRPELSGGAADVQIDEVGEEREPVVSCIRRTHQSEVQMGHQVAETDGRVGGYRPAERGRQIEAQVVLMFANHKYGATSKVQPDGAGRRLAQAHWLLCPRAGHSSGREQHRQNGSHDDSVQHREFPRLNMLGPI